MRKNKIAILMILVTVAIMIAPASAYFAGQNIETKAERMVEIAEEALERVTDLAETVDTNVTIIDLLTDAGLYDYYIGNVSLCEEDGEGLTYLTAAQEAMSAAEETEDYEAVIDNAREALEIFRDVLKAINGMLIDVGVETCPVCDENTIEEAIERSQERIDSLVALLADEELLTLLDQAQGNLTLAIDAIPIDIEEAKEYLQTANELISEVCQSLRGIARELNPGRIQGYLEKAYQHRERMRERYRGAWENEEDIDEFLQGLGYENEEEFMNQFQEMIQNAQDAETVEEAIETLKEMGQMLRNMDNSFNQKMGNYGGQQGQQQMPGNGSGFGNMGGGNSP
jgi:tetratricopeptide (TPR) repeat protein